MLVEDCTAFRKVKKIFSFVKKIFIILKMAAFDLSQLLMPKRKNNFMLAKKMVMVSLSGFLPASNTFETDKTIRAVLLADLHN